MQYIQRQSRRPSQRCWHRGGSQRSSTGSRPIIVRFFDRKKRDEVLRNRRNLKMKVFVVGEDLTYANYQVSKKAMEHSATLAVWSSNGRILAKVKNGRKLRILDFFNFICICTDTVVVLNYALFVYLCGVCDSSVCFEIQDARILSLRLSTCDMPDMLCGMLAVLTGACSTKLLKPSVRTTCYFQGVFTTMAPICVVFVCIYMCVKIILLPCNCPV